MIFTLAFVNAADEEIYGVLRIVRYSFYAIAAPTAAVGFVIYTQRRRGNPLILHLGAYLVLAVGLCGYGTYAANGKTDPNTAAHMHVILFPVIYCAYTLITMWGFGWIHRLISKRSNQCPEPGASPR